MNNWAIRSSGVKPLKTESTHTLQESMGEYSNSTSNVCVLLSKEGIHPIRMNVITKNTILAFIIKTLQQLTLISNLQKTLFFWQITIPYKENYQQENVYRLIIKR